MFLVSYIQLFRNDSWYIGPDVNQEIPSTSFSHPVQVPEVKGIRGNCLQTYRVKFSVRVLVVFTPINKFM